MKFTIYTANTTGSKTNCLYPNKVTIDSPEALASAVARDHVTALYKNNYRSKDNFLCADAIVWDCDNDHTDNPSDWITPEKLASGELSDVAFVTTPSRHNNLPKEGKSARPRFHLIAPINKCEDMALYETLKKAGFKKFSYFDSNALDAARFLFGSQVKASDVFWHEGHLTIDEILNDLDVEEPLYVGRSIEEGTRNNTMSHFASRVLKRFGHTDKAYQAFLERAANCTPPLSDHELQSIWKSAVKFFKTKIENSEDYVSPENYEDHFPRPVDYSDIGEAIVLAEKCKDKLKYTSATNFLAYGGDRWHENAEKALGVIEDFTYEQLLDAKEEVKKAEEKLIAIGIAKNIVLSRSRTLGQQVPDGKKKLLEDLAASDAYLKFVKKYRGYKNLINAQNASKPMLAVDVSELDYDAELLNTPDGTYDLSKGVKGKQPHDPDDLITKITSCAPGDKGMSLWLDSLKLFFCDDQELIDYVQQVVGLAAIGKVYQEHMIIAYGGGANGKSTFWNTIARVMGDYSGTLSADALTTNVKRNVKPEMAELKGKRLVISSELEEGQRLSTGMVKNICSTDPIEAEKKYKSPFHFYPSHTLVLYTNYLPKVSANDDGTWRRLIVIPFNAKITGSSDIKNYSEHLYKNAGPAIMKWIIEGAQKAIKNNHVISEPKAVKDAIKKYREDSDWLGQFIEDYCDVGPTYSVGSGELYRQYRAICISTGEYIRSTTDFYGSLDKAGFIRHKTRKGKFVHGLKLKDEQDFLE